MPLSGYDDKLWISVGISSSQIIRMSSVSTLNYPHLSCYLRLGRVPQFTYRNHVYLLKKVLYQFFSILELQKWVPVWETWPVFISMILIVLKNDLKLVRILMLIIMILTITSTVTTMSGNFLLFYAFLNRAFHIGLL